MPRRHRSPSAKERQHIADVLARYKAEYLAVPGIAGHWSAADPFCRESTNWIFYEGFMGSFTPGFVTEAIPLLVLFIVVDHYGGAWAMAEAERGWEYAAWHPDVPELLTVSDLCSGRWNTDPPDEPVTPESTAWYSFSDIENEYLTPSNKRWRRKLKRAERYLDRDS